MDADTARALLQSFGSVSAAINAHFDTGNVFKGPPANRLANAPPLSITSNATPVIMQAPSRAARKKGIADGTATDDDATKWHKAKSKSKSRGGSDGKSLARVCSRAEIAQSDAIVRQFLETYKTSECSQRHQHHDQAACFNHHGQKDRRRNPFRHQYAPDSAQSPQEKMYHPLLYRTSLCKTANHQGRSKCTRGDLCSFAHSQSQIRTFCEDDYASLFQRHATPHQNLASFFTADTRLMPSEFTHASRRSHSASSIYDWGGKSQPHCMDQHLSNHTHVHTCMSEDVRQ